MAGANINIKCQVIWDEIGGRWPNISFWVIHRLRHAFKGDMNAFFALNYLQSATMFSDKKIFVFFFFQICKNKYLFKKINEIELFYFIERFELVTR
jgi:hypothetical protein